MNLTIEKMQQAQVRKDLPAFRPGDTVRVHVRLKEAEGEKERIQPFEGVVIKKRGKSHRRELHGAARELRRRDRAHFPGAIRRRSARSKCCARAACAAPSSITCAGLRASRRASSVSSASKRPETAAPVKESAKPSRRTEVATVSNARKRRFTGVLFHDIHTHAVPLASTAVLKFATMRRLCSSRFEREARKRGWLRIAGLDEAGRGSLFGPVVAAAVILDPKRRIVGLDDSKKLSAERREVLAMRIREHALAWGVAQVDARRSTRGTSTRPAARP